MGGKIQRPNFSEGEHEGDEKGEIRTHGGLLGGE
jgi:hypothetical protein